MRFRQTCAAAAIAVASMIGFGAGAPAEAATAATAASALAPVIAATPEVRQDGQIEKVWHRGRPHHYRPRPVYPPRYYGPRYYGSRYPVAPPPRRGLVLPRQHVAWCSQRYRSYRSYDNTFQPYNGPRRICVSPYMR
nr:BA14K family protein [Stappia sp. TSB10GB4]